MTRINFPADLPDSFGDIDGSPRPDDIIARAATLTERERCANLKTE